MGKPQLLETDGPNGINSFLAGMYGNNFTGQSALGYTWNKELAQRMGETFGAEMKAFGVAGVYAPGVDIHRSPFSGRNYEYVSEDGLISGQMVAAELKGISQHGIYTYLKHFAANDQETNRANGGLATWLNERTLREVYLRGFEIAVKEGKALRRASHNILYMVANSNALETAVYGPYPFVAALCVAAIVAVGLFGLYLWRRHAAMVRWRGAGRPKGRVAQALSKRFGRR
ncbi:glycoside hydrolase family 3 N-terminal domain-containing protein [Olsenella urininfantis]|uniref:glycoside hydrolase family 3 N-terminal domain-containing protein n=1 Tax=Olsenella urininfantis TaxID=1871033 RepID=UPI000985BD4F|nr:glycoside hydrolase family 3 N-terminal domain-containing protein [Olsenella urininfantis]